MKIYGFFHFVNESYKGEVRAPLYHNISLKVLISIINDDVLKKSPPSFDKRGHRGSPETACIYSKGLPDPGTYYNFNKPLGSW